MLAAILYVQSDLISAAIAAGDYLEAAREAAVVRDVIRGWVA